MVEYFGDVNKDSSLKAKDRTMDSSFILKDNKGPRTKAKSTSLQYFDRIM